LLLFPGEAGDDRGEEVQEKLVDDIIGEARALAAKLQFSPS
jgi:hypothetical protein